MRFCAGLATIHESWIMSRVEFLFEEGSDRVGESDTERASDGAVYSRMRMCVSIKSLK
jgi:hypothetical protein